MNISAVRWNGWDAVRCSTDTCELIAGISAGPRILSLRYRGGDNLLYVDDKDFRVGDWRIYGGHRFTTAPENDASYFPDNAPCKVTISDAALKITAPQRPDGIRLSLIITAGEEGFDIEHVLAYHGAEVWEGALWAITCVPRSALLEAGRLAHSSLLAQDACIAEAVHFWPGTDPGNWEFTGGRVNIKAGDFRAKAGWYMEHPELSAIQPAGALSIKSPAAPPADVHVDNGCNVEVFVCADFTELETLSCKLSVQPGASARHYQQWRLSSSPAANH
ncbi:hypothetical protein [Chitinophaga cymbidii]|uniref:Uncharacterized protein n=1 Tax=Chitinophaga cymbidii TaxID=1096750 RepID=A0A512RPC9_9BACT|nr:hypothetical protein [Chitinophaga cymbidii]GEP97550.1 hypothetical protein CCY01nite_38100 [Chitinophaga cymbidii]